MEVRKWFTALMLGSTLLLGAAVINAQDGPATPPRDGVSLTVYNSGSALVQDRRTFTFEAGESVINFTDVASGIDATSVSFKSLTDFGRIPTTGDQIAIGRHSYEVMDMDGHRVDKVLIRALQPPQGEDDDGTPLPA